MNDHAPQQNVMITTGSVVGLGSDVIDKPIPKPHISPLDVPIEWLRGETAHYIVETTTRDILLPLGIVIAAAGLIWKVIEWRQKNGN